MLCLFLIAAIVLPWLTTSTPNTQQQYDIDHLSPQQKINDMVQATNMTVTIATAGYYLPVAVTYVGAQINNVGVYSWGATQSGLLPPPVREPKQLKSGNAFHYDELNGGKGQSGPTQLQKRYPDTKFKFARRGQSGPDVEYKRGSHPSSYPDSKWPQGYNHGDFKPNTKSAMFRFIRELISGKLPPDTLPLPYDPVKKELLKDYLFDP